jgi:hypothetical protein
MRRDLVPRPNMIRYVCKRARRDARARPAKVRKRRAGSEVSGVGFLGPVGLRAGVSAFGAERVFVCEDEGAVEGQEGADEMDGEGLVLVRGLKFFEARGCAGKIEFWGFAYEAELSRDVGVFLGGGEGVPGLLENCSRCMCAGLCTMLDVGDGLRMCTLLQRAKVGGKRQGWIGASW